VALGQQNVDAAVNYLTNVHQAGGLCREIESLGSGSIPIQADVSESKAVSFLINALEKCFGSR
jgi:hypothetical protein